MARTLMKESIRDAIYEWMESEYDKKHSSDIDKPLKQMAEEVNKVIRKKYPEGDMAILRKYNCTRIDTCLKFTVLETGRVLGIDFYDNIGMGKEAGFADLPSARGCNSGDVFPVTEKAAIIIEQFKSLRKDLAVTRNNKLHDYRSFLAACKTVDEFNETVPLPEDLKQRFLAGGALIAINPETIATIKSDFK